MVVCKLKESAPRKLLEKLYQKYKFMIISEDESQDLSDIQISFVGLQYDVFISGWSFSSDIEFVEKLVSYGEFINDYVFIFDRNTYDQKYKTSSEFHSIFEVIERKLV